MGYLAVAVAATLWGLWAIFLRPAQLSGPQISLLLFAVMAVPALATTRRPLIREKRAAWTLVVLGLSDAANAVLYFEAIRRGPLAVAVLTHYLAPLLVALIAPYVLGEPRSKRALLGAPVALIGLALVIYQPGAGFPLTTALLGAGSAVFYAVNVITSKAAGRAYSAIEVTSLHAVISVLALALIFRQQALPPLDGTRLAWALAGAGLNGLIAVLLFNVGLRRIPAHAASALTYLEPLTAAVVGALLFQEPFGVAALVGTALVLASGAWVAMEAPDARPVALG